MPRFAVSAVRRVLPVLALSLPLFFLYVLPGLLAYAVVGIWYLYRSLKGWMRFADRRFPDNPPADLP